jgi:hypothetical protein
MPSSYIRDGLLINLKATTQQANRLLDRQNWQQIAQFFGQYYTGMVELAMTAGNQQLAQIIVYKGMSASTEAMRQILETFDIRNVDRLVVKEIEDMVKNGLQSLGVGSNGNNGTAGAVQTSGMDRLNQMLSSFGNAGTQPTSIIQNGR